MLWWLAELVLRLLWSSTDGIVRFDAAMIVVGLNVAGLWRLAQWIAKRKVR